VIYLAQAVQKANHPRVFTRTRCKTKRSTTRTTKQRKKLKVDAHTKKGVIHPVMVTIAK